MTTSANKHHSMPAHHCWTVILRSFYSGLFFRRDEYEGQGSFLSFKNHWLIFEFNEEKYNFNNCSAACLGAIMLVFLVQWSRLAKRSRKQSKQKQQKKLYLCLSLFLSPLSSFLFSLTCLTASIFVWVCVHVCVGGITVGRGAKGLVIL